MRTARLLFLGVMMCPALCAESDQLATAVWSPLGPRPVWREGEAVAGRVTALALDPRNADVVYLGSAGGGVWKSTDGGATWKPLTDAQPSLAIGALAIAPSQPDTVYAGTGEANFGLDNAYGAGVLRSDDAGATWVHLPGRFTELTGINTGRANGDATARIAALAVHPTTPQVVLAAVQFPPNRHGIYRSADAGATWSPVLLGAPPTQVLFDPSDASGATAFAALGNRDESTWGVWRSLDAGRTWARMGLRGAIPYLEGTPGRVALAAGRNRALLYAGVERSGSGDLLGLYASSDRGETWKRIVTAPDYCAPTCGLANVLAVSRTDANTIYAAGSGTAYRSLDGGSTWTTHGAPTRRTRTIAMSADGLRLYAGGDAGAWRGTSTSTSWANLNATLAIALSNPGFLAGGDRVVAGFSAAGLARFDGQWSGTPCADAGYVVSAGTSLLASCDGLALLRSADQGRSWTEVSDALRASGDRSLIPVPVAADPYSAGAAYTASHRVWRTPDAGNTWQPISDDLTPASSALVSAIAPANENVVYAGTSDGHVLVTSDAEAPSPTWLDRSAGLPRRLITSITVHPASAAAAFATFSGFTAAGTRGGHIFRTIDAGLNWIDISASLPNTPANHLLIDPFTEALTVATDGGVFVSKDGGATWTEAAPGLPRAPVVWLVRDGEALYAATRGRGIWKLAPDDGTVSLSPASADFGTLPVGTTSAPAVFTLTNARASAISISSSTVSAGFALSGNCGAQLDAGASCTLEVRAIPTTAGELAGTLSVVTDAPGSPHTTSLRALADEPLAGRVSLSAKELHFPVESPRTVSHPQTVTLSNTGTATLRVRGIATRLPFAVEHACPALLPPGATCEVRMWFSGGSWRRGRGRLVIESDAPGGTATLSLAGTVVRRR